MRRTLECHPTSPCSAVTNITVDIAHSRPDRLVLTYTVIGKIDCIRWPAVAAPVRSDGLWQHSCFEAFIGASQGPVYYEFNFAPSTQWAAYRFISYRTGIIAAAEIGAPAIDVQSGLDSYTLRATLDLGCLSALSREASWRLGLAAVIEETSGQVSYWALAHPLGRPDFHHADCFAHQLPPPQSLVTKHMT